MAFINAVSLSAFRRSQYYPRSKMIMHRGHDHTHNHDHSHKIVTPNDSLLDESKVANKYEGRPISSFGSVMSLTERPAVRIIFAAFLVLIPAFLRRKLGKLDAILFGVTVGTLSAYDSARTVIKSWIGKMKLLQSRLAKHSTPLNKNYFFKNENAADRITLLGVVINVMLSVAKFIGGVRFHSAVLVADAGHSLSDLLSDFITLWAVQIARIPPDDDHPYGHGKFEAIGSLFLSITLILTGLSVGTWSYGKMRDIFVAQVSPVISNTVLTKVAAVAAVSSVEVPSWPALILAGISIISKEWLFQITKNVGTLLNSQILIANAWHHRSDAFSSVLSLASIGIAITFPSLLFLDPIGGIVIAGMISMTGFEVMSESIKQLTDYSDEGLTEKIADVAMNVRGVLGVKRIRGRSVGSVSLVDLTILTDHQLPASQVEDIASKVRFRVMEKYSSIADVTVHSSPVETYCPLLNRKRTRTVAEVEAAIQHIVSSPPQVEEVKKIAVHHVNTALMGVEVVLKTQAYMSLQQCKMLAAKLKQQILANLGIDIVEISLSL